MKKSVFAAAALAAFAGVASAQSSVELFGVVDVSARSVSNGSAGSLKSLSTDGQASSRLGFRGVEDIGGGLKAGFWLESAVAADSGAAGSTVGTATGVFWARRSTVSLSGGFGEVRLGRDWTPTFRSFQNFEPFGTVGVASGFNVRGAFYSNAGLTAVAVRNSNSITYFLPSLGGVTGSVQVSAGENAVNQNKSLGGHLEYSAGPILVAAGYDKLAKTLAMVDDLKTVNVGASFNAGFATVMGVYDKSQYSTLEQKIAVVSLVVPVGAGVIKAQYTKASGTGPTATPKLYDAKAYGLGYVYNMSKRSSLYANYGSIDNGANAKFVATGSVPAAMKAGETSKGYEFGIRHNF